MHVKKECIFEDCAVLYCLFVIETEGVCWRYSTFYIIGERRSGVIWTILFPGSDP